MHVPGLNKSYNTLNTHFIYGASDLDIEKIVYDIGTVIKVWVVGQRENEKSLISYEQTCQVGQNS